jgi:hypothetical protein
VVLATSELHGIGGLDGVRTHLAGNLITRVDSTLPGPDPQVVSSTQVLRTTFSSIPVVWQSELAEDYQELGEALGQMTELDEESEWRIDPAVCATACFIATGLMINSYPAPRIFAHGPESVVFNWSGGADDLYLTISANKVSALISSPERIKRRVEFAAVDVLDPGVLFPSIQSADPERSITSRLNGAIPDLYELLF